jgi:hypothetical protein
MSHNARSYQDFRGWAKDPALSVNEKCGVPDNYRAGQSAAIFADIAGKLPALGRTGAAILDIGAGCSELAQHIVAATAGDGRSLTVIDCPEMLELLPDPPNLTKVEGPFPDCLARLGTAFGPFDVILAYSVVQLLFAESNLFGFIDAAAQLLNEGGQLLIGDVPNAAMRKRLLASDAGRQYHAAHYGHLPEPRVAFNEPTPGEIDDGVVIGLLFRMRAAGFHAYAMPQAAALPMANRREDILIVRP